MTRVRFSDYDTVSRARGSLLNSLPVQIDDFFSSVQPRRAHRCAIVNTKKNVGLGLKVRVSPLPFTILAAKLQVR